MPSHLRIPPCLSPSYLRTMSSSIPRPTCLRQISAQPSAPQRRIRAPKIPTHPCRSTSCPPLPPSAGLRRPARRGTPQTRFSHQGPARADALMAATPTDPGSQSGSRPSVPGLDAAAGRSAANAKRAHSGIGRSRRNSAALVTKGTPRAPTHPRRNIMTAMRRGRPAARTGMPPARLRLGMRHAGRGAATRTRLRPLPLA